MKSKAEIRKEFTKAMSGTTLIFQDGVMDRAVSWIYEEMKKMDKASKSINVVCRCGAVIPEENIVKWNGCNEEGEEYGVVTADCKKCGADYETSQWGEWESFEEAKNYLDKYINE